MSRSANLVHGDQLVVPNGVAPVDAPIKEDLASGSLAALPGGVAGFMEMPATDNPRALAEILSRADGGVWSDNAFSLGAAPKTQIASENGKHRRDARACERRYSFLWRRFGTAGCDMKASCGPAPEGPSRSCGIKDRGPQAPGALGDGSIADAAADHPFHSRQGRIQEATGGPISPVRPCVEFPVVRSSERKVA